MSETDQYARTGPRPTTPLNRVPSPTAPTVPTASRDQYQHPHAHPRPAQEPAAGSPGPRAHRAGRASADASAAVPSRAASSADAAAPVFVDVSGRRRRLAHRIAAGLFLAAGGYALMVIWSLLGGPVSPDTLMPFSTPQSIGSSARPDQPTVTADAGARVAPASPRASQPAGAAAGSAHSSAAAAAPMPSPSPSASTPGRRPTSAPGKPTSSSTAGHGH